MKRYDIYLGCKNTDYKDENTRAQVKKQISKILCQSQLGFSITNQLGGYLHEDGTYIIEDSLKITLIGDIEKAELEKYVKALKDEYNQEKILVISRNIDVSYIKDRR